MNKEIVIINKNVNGADNAIKFFSNKKDILFTEENNDLSEALKNKISNGYDSFIICGGDGTINHFINSYMKLAENLRKNIKIGIIPCGRANDLARKLEIPFSINKAYGIIKNNTPKKIDIIQVNEKFFITGGGFGLPSEIIESLNNTKRSKSRNKILKDLVYYFQVLKKIFLGYNGIQVNKINEKVIDKCFMFLAIQNQDFIGKRFRLSPKSINSDGIIEFCAYPKPKNFIKDVIIVQKVIKGQHIKDEENVYNTFKNINIKLKQPASFMADGELLVNSNIFNIKVLPKAIRIIS